VAEKVKFIEECDRNPSESKVSIAARLNVPVSTLKTILSKKDDILQAAQNTGVASLKRKRDQEGRFLELDKAILTWFQQKRAARIPISGPLLQTKAREFALKLGVEDFQASNGWLQKFKNRHGITGKCISGESGSVDTASTEHWKTTTLPNLLKGYAPRDVFNADETGLFYHLLPSRTLAEKSDTCHGGKQSKDRLTVLVLVNADGSNKFPLLVIGKHAKPRCFKNVRSLPTKYDSSKNAWMTQAIFQKQLHALDAKMGGEGRKILLFIDGCPAHPVDNSGLRNIEVVFLPANCTSVLQPCDLGIIECLKSNYRKAMMHRLISSMDLNNKTPEKLTVLRAMYLIAAAWDKVQPHVISACFRKAGFVFDQLGGEEEDAEPEVIVEPPPFWEKVSDGLPFEDFVNVDKNLSTSAFLSDEEIAAEVRVQEDDSQSENEEGDDGASRVPTFQEAESALEVLRLYLQAKDVSEDVLGHFSVLENAVFDSYVRRLQQGTLDSFFKTN